PIIRDLPLKLNPLLRVWAANGCRQSVGDGVRAFGRRIERLFERAARLFETSLAYLDRHADRVTNNGYAAAEGKIDGRVVPVVEHDSPADGERNREDRPPRCARKLDDTEPRDARDFWNVGGERHIPAFGERIHHTLESAHASFDVISAPVIAA